jgi:alkaline phosphatase D
MHNCPSRRDFLKNLALASLVLPGTFPAWAQQKIGKNPFGLGVASGSATHESVVLWTRLYDEGFFSSNLPNEAIPVKWEVAADEGFDKVVQSGVSHAIPGLAHSVHAEVTGLQPDKWFFYRFRVSDFTSPIGRTRTFTPPGQAGGGLKVAFASCQNFELGYFNSYPHLIKESPDLVIFLGDYIYEYPPGKSGVRSHAGGWCLSLDDYRRRYAQYKQDAQLQQIHAYCPWLVTWDDHEVQNDYAGTQEGSQGPSMNFVKRRAGAYQAFYEHMPLRASVLINGMNGLETGAEMRIYDNYRIGRLLNISMLDTRQYRSPQACTPDNKFGSGAIFPAKCESLQSESRTMLGVAQEHWLQTQIEGAKDQVWTLIAQSTLFGPRIYQTRDGSKVWNDGWDGYPAARKRLTDLFLKYQVPNPVILGGDVHENWVGYIKEDYNSPSSKNIGVEFCGTSISSYDGKATAGIQLNNPHFIYSEGTRKGYAICEVSNSELVVHMRAVKDHRTAESDIEALASFRVVAGSRKLDILR